MYVHILHTYIDIKETWIAHLVLENTASFTTFILIFDVRCKYVHIISITYTIIKVYWPSPVLSMGLK